MRWLPGWFCISTYAVNRASVLKKDAALSEAARSEADPSNQKGVADYASEANHDRTWDWSGLL
jgi:hypothetical protein